MITPNYEKRFSLTYVADKLQVTLTPEIKNSPLIKPKKKKPLLTRNDATFFNRQVKKTTRSAPEIKVPQEPPVAPSNSNGF